MLAAVGKLKQGKSEGGSLSSDHLIFTQASSGRVLAPVFTGLLRHGHMPLVFTDVSYPVNPKG